ncbi:hypothetical protein Hanom_Chr14g01326941 [Helianthus anomalus]
MKASRFSECVSNICLCSHAHTIYAYTRYGDSKTYMNLYAICMGEAFKGREGAVDPPNFSLSSGEYVVFV